MWIRFFPSLRVCFVASELHFSYVYVFVHVPVYNNMYMYIINVYAYMYITQWYSGDGPGLSEGLPAAEGPPHAVHEQPRLPGC